MIRHPYLWLSALAVLPAGCSNGGETNRAPASQNAPAPDDPAAAASAAPAPDVTAEAGAACPFPTRNWSVTLVTSSVPGGEREIMISGEIKGFAQLGQPLPQPPEIVLDVDNDPTATGLPPPDWAEIRMGYDYDPAYIHAVVRCAGREIARLPIPRG